MGPQVPPEVQYSEWKPSIIVSKKRKNAVVECDPSTDNPAKKTKRDSKSSSDSNRAVIPVARSPVGMIWDEVNWSCAYDSFFGVLLNFWIEDPVRWSAAFHEHGELLTLVSSQFAKYVAGTFTPEQARNAVRRGLYTVNRRVFAYGPHLTSIDRLAMTMLSDITYASGHNACFVCGCHDPVQHNFLEAYVSVGLSESNREPTGVSINEWMRAYMSKGRGICRVCANRRLRGSTSMHDVILKAVPPFVVISLDSDNILLDQHLIIDATNGQATLNLRGIVYGGEGHFTCRIVRPNGETWFHDGITTGSSCVRELDYGLVGNLLAMQTCRGKRAIVAVYVS
ncbi:hypothetical protein B0H16DRAFT_1345954 [Mycena metata]|uniref:Uncharacterized protein n=1 Tax=Mycena metata TaxID=1033252 RepID=A0AAD7GV48_9AGAR|nr:hypothetical protein B0H16DRAFT_1345954 [Mycena metata]